MFKNKVVSALWLLRFVKAIYSCWYPKNRQPMQDSKKLFFFFQDTIDSAKTKTERKCLNQD